MALKRCSRFAINGGNLNVITGSQHVYHGSVIQCLQSKNKVRSILDEYQEIRTGKVYLKRKIAETDVKIRYRKEWRNVDARRTIHAVRITMKIKTKSFCTFYTVVAMPPRDVNYVQLFGYSNMNALPALVFYDAPVPVSQIWERNNFSTILFTYFSYQAVVVQGLDYTISLEELWLDSRIGFLRKGPVVQDSNNIIYELVDLPTALPNRPSLTLQTYSNTNILCEYLNGTLSISDIIRGIRFSNKVSLSYPNDEDAKWILSSLPGTFYYRASRDIIAQYPEDRERWYYEFREGYSVIQDALPGSTFTMDDGSVRLALKLSDMGGLQSFELYYGLQPWDSRVDFAESWLSQAYSIFSQLMIGKDKWEEYCTMTQFGLTFKRIDENEVSHRCMDMPGQMRIYLFIRSIPRPCDDEDKWDYWLREAKYYWSFDSSGTEEISENERLNLGLPAFTTKTEVWHDWWDRDAYSILIIHQSQFSEPTSTELASSLGHTILEVSGGKSHFGVINDNSNIDKMDVDNLASTSSASNFDSDAMIIDEPAVPCLPLDEPHRDNSMEID